MFDEAEDEGERKIDWTKMSVEVTMHGVACSVELRTVSKNVVAGVDGWRAAMRTVWCGDGGGEASKILMRVRAIEAETTTNATHRLIEKIVVV